MKVRIPKRQVHQFGEELQLDIQFLEYPDLPTYGVRVPLPTTLENLRTAIKVKVTEVMQQVEADEVIRNQFADFLDTDLNIEV